MCVVSFFLNSTTSLVRFYECCQAQERSKFSKSDDDDVDEVTSVSIRAMPTIKTHKKGNVLDKIAFPFFFFFAWKGSDHPLDQRTFFFFFTFSFAGMIIVARGLASRDPRGHSDIASLHARRRVFLFPQKKKISSRSLATIIALTF